MIMLAVTLSKTNYSSHHSSFQQAPSLPDQWPKGSVTNNMTEGGSNPQSMEWTLAFKSQSDTICKRNRRDTNCLNQFSDIHGYVRRGIDTSINLKTKICCIIQQFSGMEKATILLIVKFSLHSKDIDWRYELWVECKFHSKRRLDKFHLERLLDQFLSWGQYSFCQNEAYTYRQCRDRID